MTMWDDEPGDVDEKDPRAFGLLFGPGGLFAPGGAKGPPAPAEGGGGAGEGDEGEDDADDEASGKVGQHIFYG